MKAVIQAGGLGTRLYPVTHEIPKPLLPVKNKPIITHIVDFLIRNGVNQIGVVVSQNQKDHFSSWHKNLSNGREKVIIFVESGPSGTFGWLKQIRDWLGKESFVLVNGDTLFDFDLNSVCKLHKEQRPVATVALASVNDASGYGTVSLGKDNYVESFLEKPEKSSDKPSLVSIGCYVLDPSVFEYDDKKRDFLMIEKDVFPAIARDRKLFGAKMDENSRFYDCGTFDRWEKAIKEW